VEIKLNQEQQLYVIPCGDGYSCFGFSNAQRDTEFIAAQLQRHDLKPTSSEFGTLEGYAKYRAACQAWASSSKSKHTWFTPGTPPKVQRILEQYRESGDLIRLFLGDKVTGRDWMEENDVVGRIGRSAGSQKVPLLIVAGDDGGGAILTDSIIRLLDVGGRELYSHPTYEPPLLELRTENEPLKRAKGYTHAVFRDGKQLCARFRNAYEAAEYVEFMTGKIATRRDHLLAALRAT